MYLVDVGFSESRVEDEKQITDLVLREPGVHALLPSLEAWS